MAIIIYELDEANEKSKTENWNRWLKDKSDILNEQLAKKARGDAQQALIRRWKTKLNPINNLLGRGITIEDAVQGLVEQIKQGGLNARIGQRLEALASSSKLSELIKESGIDAYNHKLGKFYDKIKEMDKSGSISTEDLEKLCAVASNIQANTAYIGNALGGIGQMAGTLAALNFANGLLDNLRLDEKTRAGVKIEIRDIGNTLGKTSEKNSGFKITTDTMAIIRIPQEGNKDDYVLTFNFSDKFSSDFKASETVTSKRIKLATRSVEHFLKDVDGKDYSKYQEILMNYFSYHRYIDRHRRIDWIKSKKLSNLNETIGLEMLLKYFQGSGQKFFDDGYKDQIDIMVYGNKLFFPSNVLRSRNNVSTFGKRSRSWSLTTTAAEERAKWFIKGKLNWSLGKVTEQVKKGKESYLEGRIKKIKLIYNQFIDLSPYIGRT